MSVKTLQINKSYPEVKEFSAYGGVLIESKNISKKKHIIITGAHASGKSRMIEKLYANAELIWSKQIKPYNPTRNVNLMSNKPVFKNQLEREQWQFPESVYLIASDPIGKWVENDGIAKWWNEEERFNNDEGKENPLYEKLPAWRRLEMIEPYLKATRAILFVDNAEDLSGRKLTIIQKCIPCAFRFVFTCEDENRLSPSVRQVVLDKDPQIIRLNTEVAYDATGALAYIFMLIAFLAGSPEFALAIGAFELMKKGAQKCETTMTTTDFILLVDALFYVAIVYSFLALYFLYLTHEK